MAWPVRRVPRHKAVDEKQRLKAVYDVSEKQMRNYYAKPLTPESTGTVLLSQLETRADSAIFRTWDFLTMYAARRYVAHGRFMINGRRIQTPSHQRLKVGDVICGY
jgi:small subunit ribosomal protein S4